MSEEDEVGFNVASTSTAAQDVPSKPSVHSGVDTTGCGWIALIIVGFLAGLAILSEGYHAKVQEPLIQAVNNGDVSDVRRCLDSGADPLIPDEGGATAIAIAVRERRSDIVKVLLAHGCNPNDRIWEPTKKEPYNRTPIIDVAKRNGDKQTVQLLRQAGAKN